MTKEERKVLERDCFERNLPPEKAYTIGKMMGWDEVLAELKDCLDKGVETFPAAAILLKIEFEPKIADMAEELLK